ATSSGGRARAPDTATAPCHRLIVSLLPQLQISSGPVTHPSEQAEAQYLIPQQAGNLSEDPGQDLSCLLFVARLSYQTDNWFSIRPAHVQPALRQCHFHTVAQLLRIGCV